MAYAPVKPLPLAHLLIAPSKPQNLDLSHHTTSLLEGDL